MTSPGPMRPTISSATETEASETLWTRARTGYSLLDLAGVDSVLAVELVVLSDLELESDDSLDSVPDVLSDLELESESDDSLDSADAFVLLLLRFP